MRVMVLCNNGVKIHEGVESIDHVHPRRDVQLSFRTGTALDIVTYDATTIAKIEILSLVD